MRRALAALAAALLLALVLPGAAAAQINLLAEGDAVDLAQSLADAQAEQGVCYGWDVSGSVISQGSSTGGPGQPLEGNVGQACSRGFVLFRANVVYECSTCDGGDTVVIQIVSNLPNPPTLRELQDLGYEENDLAGDKDDQALMDMVGALPLLVAEHGGASPVEFESPKAADVPASDRPTNSPGSDTVRTIAPLAGTAAILIVLGIFWFLYKLGQHRRRDSY